MIGLRLTALLGKDRLAMKKRYVLLISFCCVVALFLYVKSGEQVAEFAHIDSINDKSNTIVIVNNNGKTTEIKLPSKNPPFLQKDIEYFFNYTLLKNGTGRFISAENAQ